MIGTAAACSSSGSSGAGPQSTATSAAANSLPALIAGSKHETGLMIFSNALLNQMQAVFPLVGNPTAPDNHELELNIEMWRILINQMQTRIERMEQKQEAGRNSK